MLNTHFTLFKKTKTKKHRNGKCTGILWGFLFTLKHNAMKCKIKNTGTSHVKYKYGKYLIQYIVPYFYVCLFRKV